MARHARRNVDEATPFEASSLARYLAQDRFVKTCLSMASPGSRRGCSGPTTGSIMPRPRRNKNSSSPSTAFSRSKIHVCKQGLLALVAALASTLRGKTSKPPGEKDEGWVEEQSRRVVYYVRTVEPSRVSDKREKEKTICLPGVVCSGCMEACNHEKSTHDSPSFPYRLALR